MTEPYRWRADPPDGTRGSEPDVPVRQPKAAATPKPAPLVTPAPVSAVPPAKLPAPSPARPAKPHPIDQKQEAAAAIGAYNELGPDYQDAVIESFLARMDQMNAARQRPPMMPVPMPMPQGFTPVQQPYAQAPQKKKRGAAPQVGAMITCIVLAIPLTAIAISELRLVGLLATWVGIIIVSFIWSRGMNRD